jgi:hypothetical protein
MLSATTENRKEIFLFPKKESLENLPNKAGGRESGFMPTLPSPQ